MTGASAARGAGPRHLLLIGVGLALAGVAWTVLSTDHLTRAHRWFWKAACAVGIVMSTWAMPSANPTPATPPTEKAPQPPGEGPKKPKKNGIKVGKSLPIGARITALDAGPDGLWMAAAAQFGFYDPANPDVPPDTRPAKGRAFDIATTRELLIVVRGGTGYFIDKSTGEWVYKPLPFSEAPGHVAAGFDVAWFCNETQSKVDWLDLKTGVVGDLTVPGVPKAIIATAGAIWVAVDVEPEVAADKGWLVRIDPKTRREVARVAIPSGATALTYGFGHIWLAFGERELVNRVDPENMTVAEVDIKVTADVIALAVADGSVWALGGATKQLDRIDPEKNEVIAHERLPRRLRTPSDLAAYEDELWLTDKFSGTLTFIETTSANKRP
ncbi:MAG: virginiamycin lyase [Thermoleophilaceae bacterium]|nr:virginiamycin lyase [Thermoleophilaceae bacterium]